MEQLFKDYAPYIIALITLVGTIYLQMSNITEALDQYGKTASSDRQQIKDLVGENKDAIESMRENQSEVITQVELLKYRVGQLEGVSRDLQNNMERRDGYSD